MFGDKPKRKFRDRCGRESSPLKQHSRLQEEAKSTSRNYMKLNARKAQENFREFSQRAGKNSAKVRNFYLIFFKKQGAMKKTTLTEYSIYKRNQKNSVPKEPRRMDRRSSGKASTQDTNVNTDKQSKSHRSQTHNIKNKDGCINKIKTKIELNRKIRPPSIMTNNAKVVDEIHSANHIRKQVYIFSILSS